MPPQSFYTAPQQGDLRVSYESQFSACVFVAVIIIIVVVLAVVVVVALGCCCCSCSLVCLVSVLAPVALTWEPLKLVNQL